MRSIKSTLPLVAVTIMAVTLLAAAGCTAGPTETRDDSFSVNGTATLIVNSDNGWIKVSAGIDNEVRVQATLRGIDRIDYEVSQDGNTMLRDGPAQDDFVAGPGLVTADIDILRDHADP